MRQILLSPVILRLAEESSFGTYKLHWSAPLQDPFANAQDDKGSVGCHPHAVILRLAEESSLSANKLHWCSPCHFERSREIYVTNVTLGS